MAAPLNELNKFAEQVRRTEHGSDVPENYFKYGDWLPGRRTRLLGAYKIPADQWAQLANRAGVDGADWRDPTAQDTVAKDTFSRLYDRYQDWGPVAVAWKAGEDLADRLVNAGQTVDDIGGSVGKLVGEYVRRVATEMPDPPPKVRPELSDQALEDVQEQFHRPLRPDTALLRRLLILRENAKFKGKQNMEFGEEDQGSGESIGKQQGAGGGNEIPQGLDNPRAKKAGRVKNIPADRLKEMKERPQ